MEQTEIQIDILLDIVKKGGVFKTGHDIYDESGRLWLAGDVLVSHEKMVQRLKAAGIETIVFDLNNGGGFWHKTGKPLPVKPPASSGNSPASPDASPTSSAPAEKQDTPSDVSISTMSKGKKSGPPSEIEKRLDEIIQVKKEARQKYRQAKQCIKKVIDDIKNREGNLDYQNVEQTVTDLFDFVSHNDHTFSYLTREIFSFDDYLYNHSINTCTIGTVVLQRFNQQLPTFTNDLFEVPDKEAQAKENAHSPMPSFHYRFQEMRDICIGFFLHDIGKVLIPEDILNKKGKLSPEEFRLVQTHSFEKGLWLLEKNQIDNPFIQNIVKYHHAALYEDESRCYPADKPFVDIPAYVMICKFSDIYDAMTSKRCYKDAFNPIGVVTNIFRDYAHKEPNLQMALYTFVKSIGICPAGSVVSLTNGQKAFVLDSEGPLVLTFTDADGNTLSKPSDPLDLAVKEWNTEKLKIDNGKPLLSPREAYDILPGYLRTMAHHEPAE